MILFFVFDLVVLVISGEFKERFVKDCTVYHEGRATFVLCDSNMGDQKLF